MSNNHSNLLLNTSTNLKNHGNEQFKPNTTVAAVIHYQGKFLLVEEIDQGKTVYNQPAGHLEQGESLIDAVKREVFEETGLNLSPDYLSGIYYKYHQSVDLYFLRFCFVIELTSYLISKPQDSDITTTHWLSLKEIRNKKPQHRSTMVLECINDYLAGNKIELSYLKSML